jgi:hypothetical protein
MMKHYWEQKQKIDYIFAKVESVSIDDEMMSYLVKYLCVVVSGFIETSVREIYSDYAQNKAHKYVANYVATKLKRFSSPKIKNILGLAACFSQNWRDELEKAVNEKDIRFAIDGLVDDRHHIAHGEDVGVTFGHIREYYAKAIDLVKLIEQQCNR